MLDSLLHADHASAPTSVAVFGLALLLALLLGQMTAWVYMATHDGLSYSRAFVVSIALLPMVVAFVMMVLANSLLAAFGLMAVFAIVRFRNIVRDTLDTVHILTVIVLGMACGTQKFTSAVVGGIAVAGAICFFRWSDFGRRLRHDYVVHLRTPTAGPGREVLPEFFARHSRRTTCAQERAGKDGMAVDLTYHLLLRDPARGEEMLRELGALPGVTHVAGMPAGQESEV